MSKSKKRPEYVGKLVHEANLTLRNLKVRNEDDTLFTFICNYLSARHMYHGFNYYNMGKDFNGNPYPVLAGSSTNYEFLQIY